MVGTLRIRDSLQGLLELIPLLLRFMALLLRDEVRHQPDIVLILLAFGVHTAVHDGPVHPLPQVLQLPLEPHDVLQLLETVLLEQGPGDRPRLLAVLQGQPSVPLVAVLFGVLEGLLALMDDHVRVARALQELDVRVQLRRLLFVFRQQRLDAVVPRQVVVGAVLLQVAEDLLHLLPLPVRLLAGLPLDRPADKAHVVVVGLAQPLDPAVHDDLVHVMLQQLVVLLLERLHALEPLEPRLLEQRPRQPHHLLDVLLGHEPLALCAVLPGILHRLCALADDHACVCDALHHRHVAVGLDALQLLLADDQEVRGLRECSVLLVAQRGR
mmetsp:Transcript_98093/g.165246  ORF Transcript_98093/g.165246 Transcript_98093/m.165246 type:complete len:326 (+) Transcript_98093:237-1214(+)